MTLWERFKTKRLREENVMWQTAYINSLGILVHHQTGNEITGIHGTHSDPERAVLLWFVDVELHSKRT